MEQKKNRNSYSGTNKNRNNRNGKGSPYRSRQNRQTSKPENPQNRKNQGKSAAPEKVCMPEAGTMLTLMGDDGFEYQYDVLASWTGLETKKRYVIYTDHSMDLEGNVQFYAAICEIVENELDILPLETEKDWEIVEAAAQKLR